MIKIILAILMGFNFTTATVDRIEGELVMVEACCGQETDWFAVPLEDFNTQPTEGTKMPTTAINGQFYEGFTDLDRDIYYYQFKSNDDSVWWLLSAEEIGFAPEANKEYTLVYYDNGTTDCTECPEEFNCECEVYDDIFLGIFSN